MRTRPEVLVLMVALGAAPAALSSSCRRTEAPPPAPAPPAAPATAPSAAPALRGTSAPGAAASRVTVQVTEEGFVPETIPAQVGKPITLAITRKTDKTCATEILFKGQEGKTPLPLNKEVEVTYTPSAAGPVKFGCAMGMMIAGVLDVK